MENEKKFKNFIGDTVVMIVANLIGLALSVLFTLFIPELLGVREYGYYQFFVLIYSFVVIAQLGINGGIYLKYGGKKYEELDKPLLLSQFVLFAALQILVALAVVFCSQLPFEDANKSLILICTAVALVSLNIKLFFYNILLFSNQIKKYSALIISEKLLLTAFAAALYFLHVSDYRFYVFGEVATQTVFAIISLILFRDIFATKIAPFKKGIKELVNNSKIGINLLVIDISTVLIVSFSRMIVEARWNIETFAQISISLSIASAVSIIVTSVSSVLFPYLKTQEDDNRKGSYTTIRSAVDTLCVIAMIMYYPAALIVKWFLPTYAEGIAYLIMFVPYCFYNTKNTILTGTYYKALRKEKTYSAIELIAFGLNIVLALMCAYLFNSLILVLFALFITTLLKATVSDVLLSKYYGISWVRDILKEYIITALFIVLFTYLSNLAGFALFTALAVVLYFKNGKMLTESFIKAIKQDGVSG